jgi:hypothetical protein
VAARNARLAFKGNKNRHYELLELDYSIAHELDPDQWCRHCGEGHNKAWWCAEKCLLGWYASPRERHRAVGVYLVNRVCKFLTVTLYRMYAYSYLAWCLWFNQQQKVNKQIRKSNANQKSKFLYLIIRNNIPLWA